MAKMKTVRFVLVATTLLLASIVLTRCSQDAASNLTGGNNLTGGSAATFTAIYNNSIVGSSCVECHKPSGSAYASNHSPLDFSSKAQAYLTLTSQYASGDIVRGGCSSVKIVAAGSPSTSFLLGTLSNNYSSTNNFAGVSGCATYPHSSTTTNLSADEITAISTWISNGAPNN